MDLHDEFDTGFSKQGREAWKEDVKQGLKEAAKQNAKNMASIVVERGTGKILGVIGRAVSGAFSWLRGGKAAAKATNIVAKNTNEAANLLQEGGEQAAKKKQLQDVSSQLKESIRRKELAVDGSGAGARLGEVDAALKLEKKLGRKLRRATKAEGGDFVDTGNGHVIDVMGPVPPEHLNMKDFLRSIDRHVKEKVHDITPIDVTGMSPAQISQVREYIKQFGKNVFIIE